MNKSWIDIQSDKSWKFRWGMRWLRVKYWIFELPWMWITNELVWDFDKYPEGRLMYLRTKEYLPEDDYRHYED